jgi:tRNA A22 N-methylase
MSPSVFASFVQSYFAVTAIVAGLGAIVIIGILETVHQEIKLKREVARRRMGKFND